MTKKFTRIIAWLCIVAHLNLMLSPMHLAYAMEDPKEESYAVSLKNFDEEPLNNTQTSFKAISPYPAHVVFWLAYSLFSVARAAISLSLVNGGDNVDIPYRGNGPLVYTNATVPVPTGLSLQTDLITDISYQLFVPNGVMPMYEVLLENSSLVPAIQSAFLNTKGNVTLTAGLQSIAVRSISENLAQYLLNVDMPTENGISSIQLMYKIYDAMTNESIANATRRFYDVGEADRFRWNKIVNGITVVFGVFLVIMGYFVVRLFCCQEKSTPVDPGITSEESQLFIDESDGDGASDEDPLES